MLQGNPPIHRPPARRHSLHPRSAGAPRSKALHARMQLRVLLAPFLMAPTQHRPCQLVGSTPQPSAGENSTGRQVHKVRLILLASGQQLLGTCWPDTQSAWPSSPGGHSGSTNWRLRHVPPSWVRAAWPSTVHWCCCSCSHCCRRCGCCCHCCCCCSFGSTRATPLLQRSLRGQYRPTPPRPTLPCCLRPAHRQLRVRRRRRHRPQFEPEAGEPPCSGTARQTGGEPGGWSRG